MFSSFALSYCLHMSLQTQYFLWSHEEKHMIISPHESQSWGQMENTVCGKLEARCDSQIDSHRRCSRATWVRSWNTAPRSAGASWALRHSPTQRLSTPEEGAEVPYPQLEPSCQATAMTLFPDLNPTAPSANLWSWVAQLCTKATKFFQRKDDAADFCSQLDWKLCCLSHQVPGGHGWQTSRNTEFCKISHLSCRRM